MERHCTAHLKKGVTRGNEILNCLKGKGCSGRRDGSRRQIEPRCENRPYRPSPSSQGCQLPGMQIHRQKTVTSPKKQPRQIITANGRMEGLWCFPHQLKISYRTCSTFLGFFFFKLLFLITNSLGALSRWCSCLMYFIFPRIARSQCEKCQLFWET